MFSCRLRLLVHPRSVNLRVLIFLWSGGLSAAAGHVVCSWQDRSGCGIDTTDYKTGGKGESEMRSLHLAFRRMLKRPFSKAAGTFGALEVERVRQVIFSAAC